MSTSWIEGPVWGARDALPLPTLEATERCDVCVVGLGGSGLTAIGALLDAGKRVVGIDAGEVAAGAAGRNGGLLLAGMAPFYHDAVRVLGRERASAIYRATLYEQARIAASTPDHVRWTQSLRIEDDAKGEADCERQLDALRADALPVEKYEGPEGRGLRFPTDLTFDPLSRCRSLAAQALALGARLFARSAAESIEGQRVGTTRGEVRCGAVIVAVDGGLEALLPELRGRVRTARLQMLATEPALDVSLPIPMYLRDGYEYVQQLSNGALALGGFRDHYVDEEWTRERTPTPGIQALLDRFLEERLGSNARVTHRWAASVGYVATPLPVVEEVRPGVWAIGGYSGTGNLMGALAARAVSALACGQTTELAELLT